MNRLDWTGGLGYFTGVILLITALRFICNRQTKLTAAGLGVVIFLLVLVLFLPTVIAQPSAIGIGILSLTRCNSARAYCALLEVNEES